jgi:hypothetical protein
MKAAGSRLLRLGLQPRQGSREQPLVPLFLAPDLLELRPHLRVLGQPESRVPGAVGSGSSPG